MTFIIIGACCCALCIIATFLNFFGCMGTVKNGDDAWWTRHVIITILTVIGALMIFSQHKIYLG